MTTDAEYDIKFREWMQATCWSGSVGDGERLRTGFRARWPIKTLYDWVAERRAVANEKDSALLDELVAEMAAAETGWLVAPYVIRFAHTVIGDVKALGRKIVPLGLKSEDKPPNWDIFVRMSALSSPVPDPDQPCAIPAYINAKQEDLKAELMPHDETALRRIAKGNLHHHFCLHDPPYEDVIYLPWYQLGDGIRLAEICEIKLFGELECNGSTIPCEGTFDSGVRIGEGIFITDYKTPEAPKPGRIPNVPVFHPYIGHQKQTTGYGLLAETKTGLDAAISMIAYLYRPLGGKGPSQRHFRIDSRSAAGKRNRARTLNSLLHIYESICDFEARPHKALEYRNSQQRRQCERVVDGTKKHCHYYDFCWNGGLETAIHRIETFK